jgi:pseudouridine-5'-phosphate glycosidase
LDAQIDEPADIARAMQAQWALGLSAGLVIANPIPPEHAMPRGRIDAAIEQALAEATAQGISGKASTPFLLARVTELTGGDSLASNIALVLNNARLGAEVAVAFAGLRG